MLWHMFNINANIFSTAHLYLYLSVSVSVDVSIAVDVSACAYVLASIPLQVARVAATGRGWGTKQRLPAARLRCQSVPLHLDLVQKFTLFCGFLFIWPPVVVCLRFRLRFSPPPNPRFAVALKLILLHNYLIIKLDFSLLLCSAL